MNSKIVMVLFSLSSLLFAGCQKEYSPDVTIDPTPPGVVTTTDSNYLAKVTIIESGTDTTDIIHYNYDSQKRVSEVYDSLFELSPSSGTATFLRYDYSYNGNDTLPYKLFFVAQQDVSDNDTITTWFTYNQDGKILKDSSITNNNESWVINYAYSNGHIYGYKRDSVYDILSGSSDIYKEFDTADIVNGDLVHNSLKNESGYFVNSTFTYDDHPSPFKKLNVNQSFNIFPTGETYFYEMPELNNRLHAHEEKPVGEPTYDEDLTGTYTYNSRRYPIGINFPGNGTNDPYKVIFEYKTL